MPSSSRRGPVLEQKPPSEQPLKSLNNKTVLITGAGSGIGAATSRYLASFGAKVGLVDRNPDATAQILEEIQQAGGIATAATADVGDPEDVESAVEEIITTLGPVSGLVCAAGRPSVGTVLDVSLDDWNSALQVNLNGTFLIIRACLPSMIAANDGSIVTIGSISSIAAPPGGGAAYKASKGAVNLLTKSVATDYGAYGIRANCLCPGSVATNFDTSDTPQAAATSQQPSPVVARSALGRQAQPEEIAFPAAFLLSDTASYITGATMMADGGFSAA